jgi:tricorn protease
MLPYAGQTKSLETKPIFFEEKNGPNAGFQTEAGLLCYHNWIDDSWQRVQFRPFSALMKIYKPHVTQCVEGLCLILFLNLLAPSAWSIDIHDTRMLGDPAVSKDHIAFGYANDLWVANLDGSNVRRLTSHPGVEYFPHFSPDGAWITFTGSYDGNTDVYIVPTEGGEPKRLTWHPLEDIAMGFTPDGGAVLYASPAQVYTRRYYQLFTVPREGGEPTKLPIPHAWKAAYSPDGARIVYSPLVERFKQWKHYRGGTASELVIFNTKDNSIEHIPQPEGRCNDADPIWMGDRIYFRSDRNGEFNLFSFDPVTKKIEQLTEHKDFPVLSDSGGGGRIIYEQAGYLHLYDVKARRANRLKIGVPTDLVETRPRFAKGSKWIRNASISPSGARAVFEFRGEIITVPKEKGDDRNLSSSPGANDRSPIWSPDGKSIAWFSDEAGEYELQIAPQDGHGEVRKIILHGAGFYEDPKWSPDSHKISFIDNSRALYILDAATGEASKIAAQVIYNPRQDLEHAWSPDSKWVVYTQNTLSYTRRLALYSLEQKRAFEITDGLSDASNPVFDPNGKYLYFFASTDAGPGNDWFSMWNVDIRVSQGIYLAVLAKGVVSPLSPESDEEKPASADSDKDAKDTAKDADKKDKKSEKEDKETNAPTVIDMDGMAQRIQALPVPAGEYASLQVGKTGQVYYLKSNGSIDPGQRASSLQRFDMEKRKATSILDKADQYLISADHKQALVAVNDKWSICELGDKIDLSKNELALDKVEVKIDPRAEWTEMFIDAWRINRDYFYDPGMHGADWKAVKAKYEAFLPDLAVRQDLNRLFQWMCSELVVGHSRFGGGDFPSELEVIPGGLLGADYKVENNRYRFAKVFGGLNWTPDLRSPLTEPGVDVKAGEYLLAVDGKDLKPPENLYSRFERTAGRIVEITVGPNPNTNGSRTVKVVPIKDESDLRNRDWVEGNIKKVTEATGGKVAYVYVPNTADLGHEYFKRYFFPQADRQAIILDERHNGGGDIADYYLDILRRPFISYWAMRYGQDLKTPLASIQGPKVMLIDETAGSGGDLLPWMFRKFKVGTLVGRRTWGGLVGILGFPTLMDGADITAPDLAIWTPDGGWVVENEGVPPDVDVEQTPAEVIAGHDPQLEKAIEIVKAELAANPQPQPQRPPFPVRVPK